jgi:hypothetical protein
LDEKVVQPLLVSTSALELATETVALILKIDDIQVSSLLQSLQRRKLIDIVHQIEIVDICIDREEMSGMGVLQSSPTDQLC